MTTGNTGMTLTQGIRDLSSSFLRNFIVLEALFWFSDEISIKMAY